jgi:hypothetical protein
MARTSLPTRLTILAGAFNRESETKRTAEFLKAQANNYAKQWMEKREIIARNVPLPLPRGQALFPQGCEIDGCSINFAYRVAEDGDVETAEFQFELRGCLYGDDAIVELQDHWRIDTIVGDGGAEGDAPEAREPHPFFHFQRGGHAQNRFAEQDGFVPRAQTSLGQGDWKALMQYPGPRVPSLPFDPILALDYCIGQNDGPLWQRLHRFPEYRNLVKKCQEELWLPFFESLQQPDFRRRWLGPMSVV